MAFSPQAQKVAAGILGIAGGYYIFAPSFRGESQKEQANKVVERSGMTPSSAPAKDGRSQTVKDEGKSETPYRHGGAQTNDLTKSNIAGTSSSATKSNSIDHDVKTRSNPNVHDGTSGGGVGVAEMRERKMEGKGLPSPQGGDTKPQVAPTPEIQFDGETGGKKKGKWWLGGW